MKSEATRSKYGSILKAYPDKLNIDIDIPLKILLVPDSDKIIYVAKRHLIDSFYGRAIESYG